MTELKEFKAFKVATTPEDYKRIDTHNIRYMARFLLSDVKAILYKVRLYKMGVVNQSQLFKLVSTDYCLFNGNEIDYIRNIEFGGRDAARSCYIAREYIARGLFDTDDPKILENCLVRAITIFEKLTHI